MRCILPSEDSVLLGNHCCFRAHQRNLGVPSDQYVHDQKAGKVSDPLPLSQVATKVVEEELNQNR
jgi:hypothetical protein